MPTHPVVAEVQSLFVVRGLISKAQLARAVKILNEIAQQAESRGYVVRTHNGKMNLRELELDIGGGRFYRLPIREKRTMGAGPNGRLEIWLRGPGTPYQGPRFRDTDSTSLDQRIGGIFEAILDAQPIADEQDARQAERDQEREVRRAQRNEQIRTEHEVGQLVDALDGQLASWTRAAEIRRYADALTARMPAGAEERAEAERWLNWVRYYADHIDPALNPIRVPKLEPVPAWKLH